MRVSLPRQRTSLLDCCPDKSDRMKSMLGYCITAAPIKLTSGGYAGKAVLQGRLQVSSWCKGGTNEKRGKFSAVGKQWDEEHTECLRFGLEVVANQTNSAVGDSLQLVVVLTDDDCVSLVRQTCMQ